VSQSGKNFILPSAIAFVFGVLLDVIWKMNLINQDNGPNLININCDAINPQPNGSNLKGVIGKRYAGQTQTWIWQSYYKWVCSTKITIRFKIHPEKIKAKSVPYSNQKNLKFEKFVNVVFDNNSFYIQTRSIRSLRQQLYTILQKKLGLQALQIIRYVCTDKINTVSFGHYKLL